jgi:hypothetical protein
MRSPVVRRSNVFKRYSMRSAAALVVMLAGLLAGPNATLDAAPQHRAQVPDFYRLKVGDLEVTALYDGAGVFDPHWLSGTSRRQKATFGCRRKSLLRRRRMRNRSSRVRKPSPRRTSRPASGTRLLATSQSSTACKSSRCLVIPRDILAISFHQRDKRSCFGVTPSMHSVSSCSTPRSPWYSTSTRLRLQRRGSNCCLSSRARML